MWNIIAKGDLNQGARNGRNIITKGELNQGARNRRNIIAKGDLIKELEIEEKTEVVDLKGKIYYNIQWRYKLLLYKESKYFIYQPKCYDLRY